MKDGDKVERMKIMFLLILVIVLSACNSNELVDIYQYDISANEVSPTIHENIAAGVVLLDVDFDGVTDVLLFRGHQGNQGVVTYFAFLKRSGRYVPTNFDEIPFPTIDVEGHRIMGSIRNWAASHSWFVYAFIDDHFVMVDSFTREVCRETSELMYIITLRDGYPVNDVYFYINDQEEIYNLFYASESKFGFGSSRWQSIFDLH